MNELYVDAGGPRNATKHGRKLIVIVLYRASIDEKEFLARLLDSWFRLSEWHCAAVLENSEDHGAISYLTNTLEGYEEQLVAEVADKNHGFSPGVNFCVAKAQSKWQGDPIETICLVNPDLQADARTLNLLCDAVQKDNIGIASPVVRTLSGKIDRGCARLDWTKLTFFAELIGVPELAKIGKSGVRNVDIDGLASECDVDIVTGACMAIRVEVFQGGLDTRLPMYLEDQEVCQRARRLGYRVCVVRSLSALHVGGESRKRNIAQRRKLRLLELVDAPVASITDNSKTPIPVLRLLVGLAGLTRFIITLPGCVLLEKNRNSSWLADQIMLSRWLLEWAVYDFKPTHRATLA